MLPHLSARTDAHTWRFVHAGGVHILGTLRAQALMHLHRQTQLGARSRRRGRERERERVLEDSRERERTVAEALRYVGRRPGICSMDAFIHT
jgi:hypothetical protein